MSPISKCHEYIDRYNALGLIFGGPLAGAAVIVVLRVVAWNVAELAMMALHAVSG